jgi:hypothetical protein
MDKALVPVWKGEQTARAAMTAAAPALNALAKQTTPS